jgi:hypothetical protein
VADAESLSEVRVDLTRTAVVNIESVHQRLLAIEALLADLPAEGVLAKLVAWDANWMLVDPSDVSAASWLQDLAVLIRGVLDEARSR